MFSKIFWCFSVPRCDEAVVWYNHVHVSEEEVNEVMQMCMDEIALENEIVSQNEKELNDLFARHEKLTNVCGVQ